MKVLKHYYIFCFFKKVKIKKLKISLTYKKLRHCLENHKGYILSNRFRSFRNGDEGECNNFRNQGMIDKFQERVV